MEGHEPSEQCKIMFVIEDEPTKKDGTVTAF